tara:strand:- start:30 stop:335 length:306 start_codon:yes stop_codon:yes gene_type:complete
MSTQAINAMPYLGQDVIRSILDINTNAIKEEKDAKEARDRFTDVRNQLFYINQYFWCPEEGCFSDQYLGQHTDLIGWMDDDEFTNGASDLMMCTEYMPYPN